MLISHRYSLPSRQPGIQSTGARGNISKAYKAAAQRGKQKQTRLPAFLKRNWKVLRAGKITQLSLVPIASITSMSHPRSGNKGLLYWKLSKARNFLEVVLSSIVSSPSALGEERQRSSKKEKTFQARKKEGLASFEEFEDRVFTRWDERSKEPPHST